MMMITGIATSEFAEEHFWPTCERSLSQSAAGMSVDPERDLAIVLGYGGGFADNLERDRFTGAQISVALKYNGWPVITMNNACASTLFAFKLSQYMFSSGRKRRALIVGGLLPTQLDESGMKALGALSSVSFAPFQGGSDGTVLGSGFHSLIVEPADSPNGYLAYCEVLATSAFLSNAQTSQLSGEDAERAMLDAVAAAKVVPTHIEAHATGTAQGDNVERSSIENITRVLRIDPSVGMSKLGSGHFLHGAGTVGVLEGLRRVQEGYIVLVNAFGFAGNYAASILSPPSEPWSMRTENSVPSSFERR